METDPTGRKRRDNAEDQFGSPLYTNEPLPPFFTVADPLFFICFRSDPQMVQSILPPGLTADSKGTVMLAAFLCGRGWGLDKATMGFFLPVINEYPAPDTQESCFLSVVVGNEPVVKNFGQHYAQVSPGGVEIRTEGRKVFVRMWDDKAGDLARAEMWLSDAPATYMTANDQYLGFDANGQLVSHIASVIGNPLAGEIVSFEIPSSAPDIVKALEPLEHVFASIVPSMLYTSSPPERIWQTNAPFPTGRAALLEILDRQARAVLIVSDDGHPLHANRHASQLLATLSPGHGDPLRSASADETARFRAALKLASQGRVDPQGSHFTLPRHDRSWPIIAELAPADPALAGPGTALVLLSDPMMSAAIEDPTVLQLLGLTAAEARIAAAVGTGLPPREAALRLGLQESTVRSALRLIFDKLGIGRQAELVQIVTRMSKN